MGKYQSGVRRQEPQSEGIHPIWRGIGCMMLVLIPVMSWAAAEVTLPFFRDQGLVPRELTAPLQTPDWLLISPVLTKIYHALLGRPGVLAVLALAIIYVLFIGGIMTVLYAFMYRMAAPSRYGPMDAPPPSIKVKKYKR